MTDAIAGLRHWLVAPDVLIFLLNVAWASGLICGLGLLVVRCLRRRPAPLRHGLLVAALLLLVLSPLLFWLAHGLSWGVAVPLHVAMPGELDGQAQSDASSATTESALGSTTAGAPVGWETNAAAAADGESLVMTLRTLGTLLLAVWVLGAAVIVAGLMRGLGTLARLRATLLAVGDPELRQNARQTFRLLGLRRPVELHYTALALAPFSLGLLKPRIVLPAGLAGYLDSEQLRSVLLHEGAHIRRRDHWVALLECICTVVFWWNPLVRRVNASLARLREQICDDHVLAAGGDGRAFAEALVRVAEWGAEPPDIVCSAALLNDRGKDGDAAELEERIVRLVRKKRPRELRMGRASWLAVAAFGLAVSAAVPIAGLRAADSRVAPALEAISSPQPEPAPAKSALARQWVMLLPAGFAHWVTLTPLGSDRYRLEPRALNSSGMYEVQGNRLVIVEPNDRRLLGFEWEIQADGHLTLVGQPPLRETGSNYLGATMVPMSE